jgi:hypothetical protein
VAGHGKLRRRALDCAERLWVQGGHRGGIEAGELDWRWIYGTLIREAGWTFAVCGDQPSCDVFEFLEFVEDYPGADASLRSFCGIKPRTNVRESAQQGKSVAAEIGSFLGPARPMPAHIREQLEWAQSGLGK